MGIGVASLGRSLGVSFSHQDRCQEGALGMVLLTPKSSSPSGFRKEGERERGIECPTSITVPIFTFYSRSFPSCLRVSKYFV